MIALIATCLLLAQSVAGSFAAAPHPSLDAFGNALCITGVDHGKPDGDHHKLRGCCILGCGAFASALASPPEAYALAFASGGELLRFLQAARDIVVAADDHDPGSARAPPPAV